MAFHVSDPVMYMQISWYPHPHMHAFPVLFADRIHTSCKKISLSGCLLLEREARKRKFCCDLIFVLPLYTPLPRSCMFLQQLELIRLILSMKLRLSFSLSLSLSHVFFHTNNIHTAACIIINTLEIMVYICQSNYNEGFFFFVN